MAAAVAAEQVSFHIHGFGETAAEVLAAKEMHRYFRVLTGNHNHKLHAHAAGDVDDGAGLAQQATIVPFDAPDPTVVLLASGDHPVHRRLAQLDQTYHSSLSQLSSPDSHLMQTVHLVAPIIPDSTRWIHPTGHTVRCIFSTRTLGHEILPARRCCPTRKQLSEIPTQSETCVDAEV